MCQHRHAADATQQFKRCGDIQFFLGHIGGLAFDKVFPDGGIHIGGVAFFDERPGHMRFARRRSVAFFHDIFHRQVDIDGVELLNHFDDALFTGGFEFLYGVDKLLIVMIDVVGQQMQISGGAIQR